MLGILLLSIFVFIIITIIVIEVRNERQYQAKRRQRKQKKDTDVPDFKKRQKPAPASLVKPPEKKTQQTLENREPKEDLKVNKEVKKLPTCTYPNFTHVRLLEMGLSDEEAKEFVQELIPQLETQIPLIEESMKEGDFHQMERLTHSIKGSATNLGTGGISDLLIECNTYLKSGTDMDIAKAYYESLKQYTKALKEQYS